MPEMFKKHPDYVGHDLTLTVGGGDQKVTDNAVLEGARWRKYASLGFLQRMSEQEVERVMARREGRKEHPVEKAEPKAAPKKEAPKEPPKEPESDLKEPSEPQAEDPTAGMTKSPASSYDPAAAATSTSTKKRSSGKKGGSKKSDDES